MTTTIAIIFFTVICLGLTTSPLIKLLVLLFPQDEIIYIEPSPTEATEINSTIESLGLITRLDEMN